MMRINKVMRRKHLRKRGALLKLTRYNPSNRSCGLRFWRFGKVLCLRCGTSSIKIDAWRHFSKLLNSYDRLQELNGLRLQNERRVWRQQRALNG